MMCYLKRELFDTDSFVECSGSLLLAGSINPNKKMFSLYNFSIFELWVGGVGTTVAQPE